MTRGLTRRQDGGDLHFVTVSCFSREQYLGHRAARETFEDSLEKMSDRYGFAVVGYVVMPEHVHLLLSEPPDVPVALALQAVKISVAKRRPEKPFWYRRYYDFNVYSTKKIHEKLAYMHHNPVKRGLVGAPEDWPWSSHQYYATGLMGTVRIETR